MSPSTLFQAYCLLESRGLIRAVPRSGYFVAARADGVLLAEPRTAEPQSESQTVEVNDLVYAIDLPLIEDDVYAELYEGQVAPLPAKARDRRGLVLHCSSFSKCLAPGYRVGWAAPGRLARQVERLKLMRSLSGSIPVQAALAEYLQEGLHALRRLMLRHFRPQQLGVEVCADPQLALRRLQDACFDVLISDYRMPRLDGVTLLAHARELDPRTVRMMLGGAADFGTVAAVNRAGDFRYIPKPWSEPQLVADLRAALAFDPCAALSADELERRRLEALEPGITQIEWGPNGEVLMPGHLPTRPGEL